MYQETSIEQAFKFITEVKKLSQIDVTEIEDQEIVLIMGPTGSGKSTFLNMMAGSKFQCKRNDSYQWEITAHPSVATVGHVLSQTFLPNYWKDQATKILYCDCPGFHDTRGYAHDIAKSYFLKQIASYAKSLKIVTIFEIAVLQAGRGSGIDGSIKQINALIENFNFETDCILVVTKCDIGFKPSNAANILKTQSKYIIPEERIFLITQPDKEGILTCLDNSIIGKAPSIKQQCHIPLSKENFLKIQQLISTLDEQIRPKTKKLEQLIELSSLDFYQNNLEATQGEIEHFENLLDSSKKEFKKCNSIKDIEGKIHDFCNHLVAKNCSSLSKLIKSCVKCINEINEGRMFLLSLLENESKMEVIKETFKFSAVNKKKRGQNVGLQSYSSLVSYLRSVDIEITDLFDSVHNKLTANPPSIKVPYDGVTNYSGTVDYSGQASYQGTLQYSGIAKYNFMKQIQINVNYTQSIPYTGSKSTPNCSHGNAITDYFGGCMTCSHHQRQIPISGVTEVSGTLSKYHIIDKTFMKDYKETVDYGVMVPYQLSIPYNGVVSYSSSEDIPCKADHHQCSCDALVYLIFAAGRIMEDICYFRQIQKEQIQQLNKYSLPFNSINLKYQTSGFVKEVKKFSTFTEEQISDQLHLMLTQSKGTFVYAYHGLQPYKGSKPYSGIQKYSGSKQYEGTVNFRGSIPCSVTLSQYYQGTLSKSVELKSCYGNCNFCTNVNTWSENVKVNLSKLIARKYTNNFYYNQDVPYSGEVKYSGAVPYSGQAQYYGLAKFQGETEVTCDQNHHDCTSCQKWVEIVDLLKVMFEDKETLAAEIQKNSQNLKETFQKIFA